MSTRIGILSDIHMRNQDREAVTAELQAVVDRFNDTFQPDHVVVLGDIIQHETTVDADRQNLELVTDILSGLDAPVQYLLGNHDVENLSRSAIQELLGQELWGTETVNGETLLFLDSSAPRLSGSRGEITDEQLSLVEDAAAATPFIFIHHPIHYRNLEETYWWDTYPERALCGNKKEINELLDGRAALAVNGHIHENDHTRYKGIDHVTVNAFNKETKDSGVTGTYAELTIDAATISITVKEQDDIVHTVSVDR